MDVLKDVIHQLRVCGQLKENTIRILEAELAMQKPLSYVFKVFKNIQINGVNIYYTIMDAITAWNKEEYYIFGNKIGKSVALTFTS